MGNSGKWVNDEPASRFASLTTKLGKNMQK